MQNKSRVKRKKTIKSGVSQSTALIVLLVVLFCCSSVLLVYQRSAIIKLDAEINELENQYQQAVKINDDLQGQILHASNISEVENYAINVLGMVKPDNSSISYYTVASSGATNASASAGGSSQFLGWINNLFK